jgi:hypothetical protein
MIVIAKIFAAIFALIVISRSIVDYKSKKESLLMTVFWIITWLAILVIAFFPKLVDVAIEAAGGNRSGMGTVWGMGLVFVMFVSYRIYVKANRIEKQLNEISRKYSLLSINKPKTKN